MILITSIKQDVIIIKKDDVYFKLTEQQVTEMVEVLQKYMEQKNVK